MSLNKWIYRRELGFQKRPAEDDFIFNRIYSSMEIRKRWCHHTSSDAISLENGAIFNLEFSPEGNILVGACEKKSVLLFDVVSTKKTNIITDAHRDNVNCIKFLDNHLFATCSDDTTVALWDLRYLKLKLRRLHGHSNWVKNIEYSKKDRLLVTSGFDGSIFTWDVNAQTEQGLVHQRVFHMSGLMRCRIAPDDSKLVVCSTGGYIMIIHRLDLPNLHRDLCGFRPSMYRLMQSGQQYIPQAAKYDHIFSRSQKRNRVELVNDFPTANDAEVILTLQIHPHGHAALSRNVSYDEKTEWTCIHDLHEENYDSRNEDSGSDDDDNDGESNLNTLLLGNQNSGRRKRKRNSGNFESREHPVRNVINSSAGTNNNSNNNLNNIQRDSGRQDQQFVNAPVVPDSSRNANTSTNAMRTHPTTNRSNSVVLDIWEAEITLRDRSIRQNRARNATSVTSYNYVYAFNSGVLSNFHQNSAASNRSESSGNNSNVHPSSSRFAPPLLPTFNLPDLESSLSGSRRSLFSGNSSINSITRSDSGGISEGANGIVRLQMYDIEDWKCRENAKKLMYYLVEANVGRGFIKEPCFSADGRIMCSPYKEGVRLLAFGENCPEYPNNVTAVRAQKRNPQLLNIVKHIHNQDSYILSSKFSPREPLLVTGSRKGKITWYYPLL